MTTDILDYFASHPVALEPYELADALRLPLAQVESAIHTLVESGQLIRTKKGRFASPASQGLVAARAVVLRSHAVAARPIGGGVDMIILDGSPLRPMLDDILLVSPAPQRGEGLGRCELHTIVRRARAHFVAELAPGKTAAPVDRRLAIYEIELTGPLLGATEGDLVQMRIARYPEGNKPIRVSVERPLGRADDIRAQLRGIACDRALPDTFPPEALAQAGAIPQSVSGEDTQGRTDLRSLTCFTIDGADAQDFDDAVSLECIDGGYRLGVHIADVSHYVRRGTPIDKAALERGTSVYLPGLTLPMLPEALSNRMCSLMPDVDRLAMSLFMTIKDGVVHDHELSPSVIHSSARLTYDQVNLMLGGEASNVPEPLHDILRQMTDCASALRARRKARGSIDFDMPEPAFTLDAHGRPLDVRARDRGESERMIEDFMLAANETVAALAKNTELPFLYRVHAKPDADRVTALSAFLSGLGVNARLGKNPAPNRYQKVLDLAANRPDAALIQQVMLRSLRRAEYAATPDGHFGLAARDYCHFTSPIRRYPDLTVHRMLKALLSGTVHPKDEAKMPDLAKHCSATEQRATLAERDADDLLKAHYMLGHVGEVFDGVVTGVTSWGLYVTLDNTVEGLLPIRLLEGDWNLDEPHHALMGPHRQQIRLGDPMTVMCARVNVALGQIDFELPESDSAV